MCPSVMVDLSDNILYKKKLYDRSTKIEAIEFNTANKSANTITIVTYYYTVLCCLLTTTVFPRTGVPGMPIFELYR